MIAAGTARVCHSGGPLLVACLRIMSAATFASVEVRAPRVIVTRETSNSLENVADDFQRGVTDIILDRRHQAKVTDRAGRCLLTVSERTIIGW